jgi:hypothetical protein
MRYPDRLRARKRTFATELLTVDGAVRCPVSGRANGADAVANSEGTASSLMPGSKRNQTDLLVRLEALTLSHLE